MSIDEIGKIATNTAVAPDIFLMKIALPNICKAVVPGQFLHLHINHMAYNGVDKTLKANYMQTAPFLRRPFSVHDVNLAAGEISILYKVVGKGTFLLSKRQIGEKLSVIGPLGEGFTLKHDKRMLLICGGMGIAPIYYLAKALVRRNCSVHLLTGFYGKAQAKLVQPFYELDCQVKIATEDGSLGEQGLVTALIENHIKHIKGEGNSFEMIYTCGPEKMMAQVLNIAEKQALPVELSLERYMACGIGICKGCSCRSKNSQDFLYTCKDGPIFNSKEVVLDG